MVNSFQAPVWPAVASDDKARRAPPPREYVRFEIIDFNGKALSKTVPARHKKGAVCMYSGALSMGANAEVNIPPSEVLAAGCPNCRLLPDWTSEQVLPWAGRPGVVVKRVYCEMEKLVDRQSPKLEVMPRTICARLLDELRSFRGLGYEMLIGGELEFTLAKRSKESEPWQPLFDGVDIFATLQNNKGMDYGYELERHMADVGIDILTLNAEYGEGQLEVAFAPTFGLAACDSLATFRTGAKEIAQNHGLLASFMAKPFGLTGCGNGGHFNFSLWEPSTSSGSDLSGVIARATQGMSNALHSATDPEGLSPAARHFLAGVLAHAPALEALCSPTPACYMRHGNWAPVASNWGPEDRLASVRVKADKDGSPDACYMELRLPSASACAYLVAAGLAAAGLDGLERGLELPPARQTEEQGASKLPTTLQEALLALEADKYMVDKLGADFVRWYTVVKRGEMAAIQSRLQLRAEAARSKEEQDKELSSAWQHMYLEFV